VVALMAPATASAAAPGVSVRAESNVTFNSAILNASVDPNKQETTYFVRWGLTKLYGGETAHQSAGAGAAPVAVSIPFSGLAPDTRYHYRVLAVNNDGITRSKDQTFRTRKQPLGVTLVATPSSVRANAPSVLTGQLTGTNNANRDVRVEASQWPYTGGFKQIGNKIVTDGQGNFTFNVLNVPFNTQFRVALAQRPEVVSPIVAVSVPLRVRTDIRTVKTFRHSKKVRFKGTVTPAPGTPSLAVQKNRNGVWTTIATAGKWTVSSSGVTFKKKVRIGKSGKFRIVAQDASGKYAVGAGRVLSIKAPK
jgi:hypothetical protein